MGTAPVRGENGLTWIRFRAAKICFAQTIYAASSADEAEGRMIVDWLRPRLLRSASEAGI